MSVGLDPPFPDRSQSKPTAFSKPASLFHDGHRSYRFPRAPVLFSVWITACCFANTSTVGCFSGERARL